MELVNLMYVPAVTGISTTDRLGREFDWAATLNSFTFIAEILLGKDIINISMGKKSYQLH